MNPEVIKPGNGRGNGHGNGNGSSYGGGSSVPYFVDAAPQYDGNVTGKLLLYAIFKRKWQVLAVLVVVVLSIMVTGIMRPKMYQTNAKIFIRPGRTEVQLSGGMQRELTLPISASAEMVNSEMEILRSKELMRQVLARMADAGHPIFGEDTTMSVAQQVAALQGMVKVLPIPDSNAITIDLFGRNPAVAQATLGAITEAYLARHAQLRGTTGATEFFEEQKAVIRDRVQTAERELAEFVDREGIVVPEDQIRWALKDALQGQDALGIQLSKISGLKRRVITLQSQIKDQPVTVSREIERVHPTALGMGAHLAKLEAKRASLRQGYQDDDRFVTAVDGEIAMLRSRIAAEQSKSQGIVGSTRTAANPLRFDIERRLLNTKLNLNDLQARADQLKAQIDTRATKGHAEAVELRQKSIELTSLEEEVTSARESYKLYEQKQEEARIAEALDRENFLNVSILDGPSTPLKPINEMTPFMLVAALIAGTGLGIGSAVGVEFFGRSFKFEEQVEQYLDMPVFAVIPELNDVSHLTQAPS